MKNLTKLAFIIALSLTITSFVIAQGIDPKSPIPIDPSVKIGKLENGMVYYIKQNKKPEKRIELRLAIDAGSILENDDQLGLAHFIEHMAFNGTTHFAKNDLISFLQSIGVRFGPDLNAFTSFDETVYMLTIATDSIQLVDKGFLVLEDWAFNLSLDNKEIDKERGVIIEEWRLGRGAEQRMLDKYLPVVFKDSRYALRLPIGQKEIIEKFKYETLKKFYKDWYRPDLMAVIAVGDFEPEEIEKKIKNHFGKIQPSKNQSKRELFKVPDHKETLVAVESDKEAAFTQISVFYKTEASVVTTQQDFRKSIIYRFVAEMLNNRLNELKEKAEPPFIDAQTYFGSLWARSKDAFQSYAITDDKGINKGLSSLLTENERVKRYGFIQGELERYKKDLLNRYEKEFLEKDKTESQRFADQYVTNYLEQEPIPGIEFELAFLKKYLPEIHLEEVNNAAKILIGESNRVVVITGPQKDGVVLPTKEQVKSIVSDIEKSDIQPYKENLTENNLLNKKPIPGKIVQEIYKGDLININEIRLSNGLKVVLRPTDFKNDQVLLKAYSFGGHSICKDEDFQSGVNAANIVKESGISSFSPTDLKKILAGKDVDLTPYIDEVKQGFTGSCSPKDLETLLQMVYLYFTDPRKDSSAFLSYIAKNKALYKNLMADPQYYFFDQVARIKSQGHPRAHVFPTEEDWNKINFNRVYEIYRQRFSDASSFNFLIVGKFNIDSIKPLLETYLGSLPHTDKIEAWKDLGIRPPKGIVNKDINKGTDPKSFVTLFFEKEAPINNIDNHRLSTLGSLLEIKYYEILREEKSGVYGVDVSAGISQFPYEHSNIGIYIPCSPGNADSMTIAALNGIKKIQTEGVNDLDITKLKEIQTKEMEVKMKTNEYWIKTLESCYQEGRDFSKIKDWRKRIDGINSDELKRVAIKYFDLNNYLKIVLYPEK